MSLRRRELLIGGAALGSGGEAKASSASPGEALAESIPSKAPTRPGF